jgi:type I restriction enzyme S subunit
VTNLHLKPGWKISTLDEVATEISNRTDNPSKSGFERFVGLEHFDSCELKIRRWGSTSDLISAMKLFSKGDTLFARRNAYLRRASKVEFDGVCSGDAIVLREKRKYLVEGFLPLLMNTDAFWEYALANAAGSMSKRVNVKSLMKYQFPLPPKDEQRRIADILWAADEAFENWRTVYCDLDSAKRTIVADMFRNGLRNERKKSSLLGQVPESWDIVRLDEAAEFLDGRRIPLKDADRAKRKGPYPYYGASGIIDHVDDFIFDESIILLSEDGFNLVHRNSPIAFRVDGKCWVNNHAHVLKPQSRIDIDLLVEYLESLSLEPYITGTYQRKLNKSACEAIPVPIPNHAEQELMTRTLESFAEALLHARSHTDRLRELRTNLSKSLLGAGNVH